MMYKYALLAIYICCISTSIAVGSSTNNPTSDSPEPAAFINVEISGDFLRWHPVTIEVQGPTVSESDVVNPFFDYRLTATFTQNGNEYVVPGYFAADGNAAESGATTGNVWLLHFTPQETGSWQYAFSLVKGTDVAIDENATVDEVLIDNVTGTFDIAASNKTGLDVRGKGALRYIGESYLQYANGDWFIKSGTDSPENILAYEDFDGTYSLDAINFIKDFDPHIQDWNSGDPTWHSDKGKGIIGAINYLASQRVNGAFILVNNLGLNDSEDEGNEDVWPWTAHDVLDRYDVSKLAQWDIVFQHMQAKGMTLHFALQEIDNDILLDNGDLGRNRKLFYREMVARFGYHNAVIWNIGEELRSDRNTDAQRKSYIDYLAGLDSYEHAIVAHTWPGEDEYEAIYGPLLTYPTFNGISFQIHLGSEATGDLKVYDITKDWWQQSTDSGRKWAIMMDECCGWKTGIRPWGEEYNLDDVRVDVLWGNLMAGGAGVEWFFGDRKPVQYDLSEENFRSYALMWEYTRHAVDFFHTYLPFNEMAPQTGLTDDEEHLVFAKPGEIYAVYLREGGRPLLNVEANVGNYRIKWYNPRLGGGLLNGSVQTFDGAGNQDLGIPPFAEDEDWVVLVENVGFSGYSLASFTHNQSADNTYKIEFDASASSSVGGSISMYSWDFGDGTSGSGVQPEHTYLQAGTYYPTLTITDNQGNEDSFTHPVIAFPVAADVSTGLVGEYYNNTSFSGTPETRIDPRINFKWGNGIPIRLVDDDEFTVRWNGYVKADHSETYQIRLEVEDGGRLWIDDVLLIDTWNAGGYTNTSVAVPLQAGTYHKLKLELIEEEGRSDVRLFWSAPSVIEALIPETHLVNAPGAVLPVELTSFEALAGTAGIHLSWTTASETNNAGFEIQRKLEGSSYTAFQNIGFVRGKGTTIEPQTYQFTDEENLENISRVYYRLKQVDFDGSFSYSSVVDVPLSAPAKLTLHKNYPNPFNPSTTIQYEVPKQGHVRLAVYDVMGRLVTMLVDKEIQAGTFEAQFDARNQASGVYFYRLEAGGNVITRSMLLTK